LNNQIKLYNIEKNDFIFQIKKQQDKENSLNAKISEYEISFKIYKQKEENFIKLSEEYLIKETEKINKINTKHSQIGILEKEIKILKKTIDDKDEMILIKANELNNLYQIKSDYESKIVNLANENNGEKENNRNLLVKLEIINSDYNLKLQLNQNQINHLNENINQLNKEINLNKENFIFQIQNTENKLSEIQVEKEVLKSQNGFLNVQISTLKKNLIFKGSELEEKISSIQTLEKTISNLNKEIKIFSETISERDLEITKIYKFKEKFDKYTYIEKNLDIFNVINAADLNTLQDEFKKMYSINKENKIQLENLKSINEKLRCDSQELSIMKEKFFNIENQYKKSQKQLMESEIKFFDIKGNNEQLNNEVTLLKELRYRISQQNKRLLLDSKLANSNFNILNSAIDKNINDYEKFLYKNIEDLESKNTDLHYHNIKITSDFTKERESNFKNLEEIKVKEIIIQEQKNYIDNLEINIKEISNKIGSFSYLKNLGLGGNISSTNQYENIHYLNEEVNKLNSKNNENMTNINELKDKLSLYEKQNEEIKLQLNKSNQELLKLKNESHMNMKEINNYKNQFTTSNLKISNLENQLLIKDNFINAANYENTELRKNLENSRLQKENILEEISNTSKMTINKLNENKQIFLDQINKLIEENKSLKNTINKYDENLDKIIANKNNLRKNNKDNSKNNEIENTEIETNMDENNLKISLFNNFNGLSNLINLLEEKDKEVLFTNNYTSDGISYFNQKFDILKKILLLADKSINNNLDNKLKLDNYNTLIYNLQFQIEIYQNRINHLENILKSYPDFDLKISESKIEQKMIDGKEKEIQLGFNSNKETIKKLKEPKIRILQSSMINSSSDVININNFQDTNNSINEKEYYFDSLIEDKNYSNKYYFDSLIEDKNYLNDMYKISLMKNTEFLKKYIDVLRKNDNFRIVNMELNAKITEIKKQYEELVNKKFDSGISSSNTSEFFFEKYNELLVEKVDLEVIISNDKNEIEKLVKEITILHREISNLKIEKKDMENLFNKFEKNFNEENENKIKTQEKLMKQIDDLNVNLQSLQKDKTNFNNVFNKIRTDKINLENINKNNLNEITNLKENIIHKDELVNTLKDENDNLNNKILELNQVNIELENKLKKSGESRNNVWVKKLITILYKSKGIIEMFIQLKNSFEEKLKFYENSSNSGSNINNINNILSSKQGQIIVSNNIFINAINELNCKMLKYENEFKSYKKKEEIYEKKISQLNNELNLLQEKEKIVGSDYKLMKEISSGEGQNKPAGTGQEIKIYFSKMVQHITTARNIINFKDGIIKKLENDNLYLNSKINEGNIFYIF